MNNIVILANGMFPTSSKALDCLHSAEIIICCDGAVASLLNYGLKPDYIVGDLDSISEQIRSEFRDILHFDSDQQCNDLTKAFNFALTANPNQIHILGASGKREDHTLGNISLLADYVRQLPEGCSIDMITDSGKFVVISDSTRLKAEVGQQISIFAFDSTLQIKSKGLEYPTDQVVFDTLWKGTLNECKNGWFEIELNHPCSVLIYFAY